MNKMDKLEISDGVAGKMNVRPMTCVKRDQGMRKQMFVVKSRGMRKISEVKSEYMRVGSDYEQVQVFEF